MSLARYDAARQAYQCKACRGTVRQEALEAAVLGVVAKALARDLRSGNFERRLDRWVDAQLGAAGDGGAAKRADLTARIDRLRAAVERGDAGALDRIGELTRELREVDAARAERPSEATLRRQAAEMLAGRRRLAKVMTGQLHPRNVNEALQAYKPLIAGILWDRDSREVSVTVALGHLISTVDVAARRRRGSPQDHTSGYNALSRAQA